MTGKRSFDDLVELIARLRDPDDGCPWDRAQDHVSLRPYVLEEAHELIAAIDAGDPAMVVDELGDVLLQVLLHSQIGSERGEFSIDDVVEAISSKLVRRHPHVFADASNDLPSVYRRWREIKDGEGRPKKAQPTLVRAKRLLNALDGHEQADAVQKAIGASAGEERAGLQILSKLLVTMREGFDPEIALLKGVERLESEE